MHCPSCGALAQTGDAFCSSCGAGLASAPAPAAPTPTAPERYERAVAHPTYQQALAYQAPAPSSDGLLWFVAGSVGFALLGTVVLVILLIDALPWTCALWLLIPVAVAIVLAVLLRRSRKGPSAYRELVVILETRRVRAVENPLELVVQFRNGARLQCYGYRPVAERMVTPGDIGVGFFTKVALQGDVMYDFVPIDA